MLANEILEMLKDKISPNEYDFYIKQLKFNEKASNDDNIVYNAPNEIIAKFIKTKYAEKIAYFFEVKTGKKVNITINTQNTKKSNLRTSKIDVKKIKSTDLIQDHTFENFVVGETNQFAFFVSKEAAQKPGTQFNPLFIYGESGLGKTHLLHSIGNFCLNTGKIVICVTSEVFMNDFIYNLKNNMMEKFREKYRNCDVLLIDDVQFLGKTSEIQNEFFHTFNEIYGKNGQIVMTSDKPPKTLKGFEERLKTRFESGLIADITPPDLATKIAIFHKKCEINNLNLNQDIINYITTNLGDNIREINGVITNLKAYKTMLNEEITLDLAKNIVKDMLKEKMENVSLERIIDIVCKEQNIKPSDIKSKSRVKNIVKARQIAIYLIRNLTSNSMPQIANYFNMGDHSNVSKNIKKINELIENDEILKLKVEEIKNKIISKG
ncbi:chromosomal replication initiator protein DnaA [Campylobacter mucosalis]|uniref:Chromosomal replication initiator protein DnaA n=2 Tax=Campylobacter mucosalis TaxID=202 RepID=A0A6G5QDV6_9BACT|nr:chromosomal replication initiator protein DnaA [Campylobacter mucosalis]QCD43828.1 chromosomal replication initiator protein [Campylobacter mucosalis CCUG 21559]QKF62180.1 chromosomal replication initiator protein [Campylobacter mucosalis]